MPNGNAERNGKMYEKNGYRCGMTVADIRKTYEGVKESDFKGGVWVATRHGPVTSLAVKFFKTRGAAFEWVLADIGNTVVDEMCYDCWKDTGDTGSEWEIQYCQLPA